MTEDLLITISSMMSLDVSQIRRLQHKARLLHLASPFVNEVPLSWRRCQHEIGEYGNIMATLLNERIAHDGRLPQAELVSPLPETDLPAYRVWVPHRSNWSLPWEVVCGPTGVPLLLNPGVSLIRYMEEPIAWPPLGYSCRHPPLVLAAASLPAHAPGVNIELQRQQMRKAFESSGSMEPESLRWFEGGSLEQLKARINEESPTAIHIVAHGIPGMILWQDHSDNPRWYTAAEFAEIFDGLKLDIAVLMVCDSAASQNGGISLIESLVNRGFPAAVGVQGRLDDVSVAQFTHGFYRGFSSGSWLDVPVGKGRIQIWTANRELKVGGLCKWAQPVLLVRNAPVRLETQEDNPVFKYEANEKTSLYAGCGNTGDRQQQGEQVYACLIVKHATGKARSFRLGNRDHYIGRSSKSDFVLRDNSVEAFHAKIENLSLGRYRVIDLGSACGTTVDGIRVQSKELNQDDVIGIGTYKFEFTYGDLDDRSI